MGLAPYAEGRLRGTRTAAEDRVFLKGDLFDGTLSAKEGKAKGLQHIDKSWMDSQNDPELRVYFEDMAYHIQKDLEDVVTKFVRDLQNTTGEGNVVFAGGVAQNSTLNGILHSMEEMKHFSVSPYPGDEGIAIGCSAFGFYSNLSDREKVSPPEIFSHVSALPYLGICYKPLDIEKALSKFSKWIKWRRADSAVEAANALAKSKVVVWFDDRSEFGPRALGSRSIIADPRKESVRDHVNRVVKKRELFRPFAPAVLAEHASAWFEDCPGDCSPFMSMTKKCKRPAEVMAVSHVDGTSRLQTVTGNRNPRYYEMIAGFWKLTGVPMVLNTSFNVAREPIVESPHDALRTFLDTDGLAMLIFPGYVVEKHTPSLLLTDTIESACSSFRSNQVQDSEGECLQTEVAYISRTFNEFDEEKDCFGDEELRETTIFLTDSLELEILEYVHTHEMSSVADVVEEMATLGEEENEYDLVKNNEGWAKTFRADDYNRNGPTQDDIVSRLANLYEKRLICKA